LVVACLSSNRYPRRTLIPNRYVERLRDILGTANSAIGDAFFDCSDADLHRVVVGGGDQVAVSTVACSAPSSPVAGTVVPVFGPGNGSPSATNVVVVVVVVGGGGGVVSTKAFSFHNRSSSNFAYTLVTTLSTIAP